MAYQLVSAPSNQEALMSALSTFAVANGWTEEHYTAAVVGVSRGVMTLSRGSCYVSFRWEGTDRTSIAMYQSLGYTPAQAASPWNHPNDSGNGTTSATNMNDQRRIEEIGAGPYTSMHLFASATEATTGNSAPHIYGVIEYAPGQYRHFGFGNLEKFGNWTGGEFCAGHIQRASPPQSSVNSILLDGSSSVNDSGTDARSCGTIHVEGLPGQAAAGRWGRNSTSTNLTGNTDRAGNARVLTPGGVRDNMHVRFYNLFVPSSLGENQFLTPCPIWYGRDTSTPFRFYPLGFMPNIRMGHLRNFEPGQEVTIGGITYKAFPAWQKTLAESGNMGIFYTKVP